MRCLFNAEQARENWAVANFLIQIQAWRRWSGLVRNLLTRSSRRWFGVERFISGVELLMPSEREFIQSLQQQFPTRAPVLTGIGDDGAVLDVSQHDRQVVVTDMLLDGVHFDLQHTSPALVGRKAIAVNLSDLAAMACSPSAAFVSIALPDMFAKSDQFCDELYEGMQQIADEYGLVVAGGDTNVWDGPFAINVCLTGIPFGSSAVLRSGARPGDLLFVTGPLGGSLQSGRHLTFEPRLEQSRYLVESLQVNAMMDISDGLAIDLHRMAEASGCGAVLQHEKIPVHADVCDSLQLGERIERALSDGEDFELLLAVAANDRSRCDAAVAERGLIEIGQMTDTAGEVILRLQDGGSVPLQATGWQHLQGPGP